MLLTPSTAGMVGKGVALEGKGGSQEGCPDKMGPGVFNCICCDLHHVTAFLSIPGDKG